MIKQILILLFLISLFMISVHSQEIAKIEEGEKFKKTEETEAKKDINLYINGILTLCAITASIFAYMSFRQAKIFKREERESRRAYLAPSEDPGHLKITGVTSDEARLLISLENYGINPANKIEGTLLSFNEADVNGTNDNPIPIFTTSFNCYNPIPNNSRWVIRLSNKRLGVSDIGILLSNYLILKIKYYDNILGQEFNDSFFWLVDTGGKLVEIDKHYKKMMELGKSFPKEKVSNVPN